MQVIAMDLGGSKLTAGVVDMTGCQRERVTVNTCLAGRDRLLEQISGLATDLRERHPEVAGLGLGTPGFVDSVNGRILECTNLPGWNGLDLADRLADGLGMPVVVENDANLAALGEAWLGAGQGWNSFLLITLGTGVGGAWYQQRAGVHSGAHYRAGELGHAILYPRGRICACGQRGCVEQYLSGTAIQQTYWRRTGVPLEARAVFQRAEEGEGAAKALILRYLSDLAILISSLQNSFDPDLFILGGGVTDSLLAWWDVLEEEVRKSSATSGVIQLRAAQLGNDAGMLGAARLALSRLGGETACER